MSTYATEICIVCVCESGRVYMIEKCRYTQCVLCWCRYLLVCGIDRMCMYERAKVFLIEKCRYSVCSVCVLR